MYNNMVNLFAWGIIEKKKSEGIIKRIIKKIKA